MNNELAEELRDVEEKMWEAFSRGNATAFGKLVASDAMMICGGLRESGREYTAIVSQVRLDSYGLTDFAIKVINTSMVMTNYVVKIECPDPLLSGNFRVSSLWIKNDDHWQLCFNQDSKLA
jgi:hypothetical protein